MSLESAKNLTNNLAITLVELLISIMIMGLLIISFYHLESFSHDKVVSADRRTKVQNALSYCMDTMSKMVAMANGNTDNPPIRLYPSPAGATGFQVRVDLNDPQTPTDLTDDTWAFFTLAGNSLSIGGPTTEVLSSRILANFNNSEMPTSPTDGFYVAIDSTGTVVDIGLVGRYDPTRAYDLVNNPQVSMKTKIYCNNSSTN